MKEVTVTCDRCKQPIDITKEDSSCTIAEIEREMHTWDEADGGRVDLADLCHDCMSDLGEFLDGNAVTAVSRDTSRDTKVEPLWPAPTAVQCTCDRSHRAVGPQHDKDCPRYTR